MSTVSLIMPVWRPDPEWFPIAVASALDETCDVELILVDDGNDEPVTAPLDDPRITVVRAAHGGPYAARDVGIEYARGTHVRFVDADDEVVSGSTSALLDAVGSTGAIADGITEVCDDELRVSSLAGSSIAGDAVDACLLGEFTVFHVSLLHPRAVVDAAGPWDVPGFTVSGDWDYVLRAVELAPVVPVDSVVTRYRRHPGSVMSRARVADGGRARELVVRRHFERHPERRGTAIERDAHAARHLDQATAHAWRGERADAARSLVRAARHRPVRTAKAAVGLAVERARLTSASRP